jgi:hypothetical protein
MVIKPMARSKSKRFLLKDDQMPISPELFKAILAMDSYNRGINAGLNLSAQGVSGDRIGNAILKNDVLLPAGSDVAGFFAQAYNWNGTTVISYRGTDNPGFFASENGPSDILNGWLSGVGVPTSQISLAMQFFTDVTGANINHCVRA